MTSSNADTDTELPLEDQLRAGTYSLLAALLRSPATADLLTHLNGIRTDSGDSVDAITAAWGELRQAAQTADPRRLDDEYHALFIGIGRGELIPYGSWYLTGFLMEKPLGELRRDLAELGYQRQENVHEPEDHVAALCEVMALLIMDDSVPSGVQRHFFESHMGSWMGRFFNDLEQAGTADFYRSVGRLGTAFIALEKQYLSMLV